MSERNHTLAYALGHINSSYIAEAEIPALTAAAACPCRVRKERNTPRFWESGWFAAAVSGIVAVGVLAAIIMAGQRNPRPPVGSAVPPPAVTETEIAESETDEPIPPYTKGLEYRALSSTRVEVVGIGTATDATVIHIPPQDEQGREVRGIDVGAFAGNTKITEVIFSRTSSLGSFTVEASAFENCTSLRRVRLCNKNTEVIFFPTCFKGCRSLSELDFHPEIEQIHLSAATMEGTPWLETQTEEFVIFHGVLLKYQGADTDVILPNNVEHIGSDAFEGCHTVTSVTALENSLLTELTHRAFAGASSLRTVDLPNLTTIPGSVFDGCPALETVFLPRSVKHLLPPSLPDNSAIFLYAGTREEWEEITFYDNDSKAEWTARVIFQNES